MSHHDIGREAIERLRVRVPQRETAVELDQASCIVEMIQDGWQGLDAIVSTTGLSRDKVLSTVVDLGTWLGQSVNAGANVTAVEFSKAVGDEHMVTDTPGQQSLFPQHTDTRVVIPPGFDRRAVGRDVSKAISQIVRADPDEAVLRRWLMRKHHYVHMVLGFETVAMVHRVCQLDRLGEIEELCDRGTFNHELARLLVEAYDFLDVARADAVASVQRVLDVEVDTVDLDAALRDAAEASWLHQAEFSRMLAALESGSRLRITDALDRLQTAAGRAPEVFTPRGVCELSDGQVLRLAQREGFDTEGTNRTDADLVRTWVTEAGLGADADLLVADGVRVGRAGLGAEFREALARRAKGDLDWSEELNEALAQISRV